MAKTGNAKGIHNINAMRPALIAARKAGNTKAISRKDAEALGISEGYFEMYTTLLEKLYNAVCVYAVEKHTIVPEDEQKAHEKEVSTFYEAIYPLWKATMECGEKAKDSKDFRTDPRDVEDLVSFVLRFANNSNDENAKKVWANDTFAGFRKKVETMLGIKIEKASVMTDAMRDYLRKEKALINKVKNEQGKIDKANATIETCKKSLAIVGAKEKNATKLFEDEIAAQETNKKAAKEAKKAAEAALKELRAEKPAK